VLLNCPISVEQVCESSFLHCCHTLYCLIFAFYGLLFVVCCLLSAVCRLPFFSYDVPFCQPDDGLLQGFVCFPDTKYANRIGLGHSRLVAAEGAALRRDPRPAGRGHSHVLQAVKPLFCYTKTVTL
jgi:hypothetical protein